MRYRTSCFNTTLSRYYVRRFWPLPLAAFLFWVMALDIPMFQYLANEIAWDDGSGRSIAYQAAVQLSSETSGMVLAMFPLAFLSAALVFHHLHSRKELQFTLGLPMTRRCIYVTSVISGFLLVILPFLLSELICGIWVLAKAGTILPVLQNTGMCIAAFMIFYTIAVLSCIFAGNAFGAFLIFVCANCVVYAILSCAGTIGSWVILGMRDATILPGLAEWLTPIAKLMESVDYYTYSGMIALANGLPYIIYAIAAVLILIPSGVLYQHRKAESAGATIAFREIRSVCKVLAAILVGFTGSVVFEAMLVTTDGISTPTVLLIVLLWTAIGWIAADMIISKSLKVFHLKNVAQFVALATALLIALGIGSAVYTNQEADTAKADNAQLTVDGSTIDITPEEACALLETISAHEDELKRPTAYDNVMTIELAMGGINYYYTRQYRIACDWETGNGTGEIGAAVDALLNSPDYLYQSWFDGWENSPEGMSFDYASLDIYAQGTEQSDRYYTISEEQAQKLYDAFVKDIEAGNVEPSCYYSDTVIGTIELHYFAEPFDQETYGNYDNYLSHVKSCYAYLNITEADTNVIAALADIE